MQGSQRGRTQGSAGERRFTPEEEAAFEAGYARVAEEKRQALLDPGPSWKVWFYHDNLRWWIGLTFLIVDSWIATLWIRPFDPLPMALSLLPAVYGEFVLWHYLWHRPSIDAPLGRNFRRSWHRPFEYGRWTPEAVRARQGRPLGPAEQTGPDARQFL